MIDVENQYGTKERQIELLEMIRDIDSILRSHGISYSLSGGTLIGAVREKGFIPWDDDIDIMVDRANFDRICALFRAEKDLPYVLNDYLWVRRIQKKNDSRKGLQAATVDVFVMDNCPNNPLVQKSKVALIKTLQGMMKEEIDLSQVSLVYKVCLIATALAGRCFSYRKKLHWYDKVSMIGNKRQTAWLGMYNDLFKNLSLKYDRDTFAKYQDATFEGVTLPITAKYDSYLTTVYGNYLTPPAEEERKPEHM